MNNKTFDNLILEIEGADDFSIKDGDKYLTLHQVKSGTIDLDQEGKKDKFSFIISLLQYNADYGYYHILPDKSIPNDFIKNTLDWIDALLKDLDKEIMNSSEVKRVDHDKYIIVEKIQANTKKGSLYNILDFVCKVNKKKEEISKSVEYIKTELINFKDKLYGDGKLKEDSQLLTNYPNSFNDSQEVKESAFMIIKEILNSEKPEWSMFIDDDYLEFVYGQIFLELKKQITNDYINKTHIEKNCRINLSSIFYTLTVDYHYNSNSIPYQYFLLWKRIKDIFQQYPANNTTLCKFQSCKDCDDYSKCNLYRQMEMVSKIESDDLYSFLYRLMLKEPVEGNANNLPDDDLISRLFISLLKEIDLLSLEDNNIIQAQKKGLFYRLTLNSSGEVRELQKQLDREMRSSKGDKLLIYESDILITDQLNEENFIYNSINTTVFGEKEFSELKNISSDSIDKIKKNYNKAKVMRLIDRRKAKEELIK